MQSEDFANSVAVEENGGGSLIGDICSTPSYQGGYFITLNTVLSYTNFIIFLCESKQNKHKFCAAEAMLGLVFLLIGLI